MLKTLIAGLALALTACAATAGGDQPANTEETAMMRHHGPHMVSVRSNVGFDATLAALRAAIDARGFKTFAVVDHAAGAASIDQSLRPTTLIIFGNPKGGTPLLQADQRLGLELPLRALVRDNEDGVIISYPDYKHTLHEYGVHGHDERIGKIMGALAAIAAEAAGAPY